MTAPFPPDEGNRLAALLRYGVLDTPPEESFDRIARVAAFLLGTPMALVSLIDEERQWFKARVGLDITETSREVAFCAHTILDYKPMVILDAKLDPRFAGNSLVTGDPGIRFYAGAPLITSDGYRLGSLCVLDTEPRVEPGKELFERLADLAAQVVSELEQRRNATILKRTIDKLRLYESVVSNANDAILITEAEPLEEPGPRIIYANPEFERMTGYSHKQIVGRNPRFLQGADTDPQAVRTLGRSLKNWQPARVEMLNYRKNGTPFWVEIDVVPVPDENGRFTHWISVQRETSERKEVERKLEAARDEAEAANRAKGAFLSIMSHEIRTPLNGVIGMTDVLLDTELEEHQRECVETIQKSGALLTKIINEILEFTRAEGGHLEVAMNTFSLKRLIHDLIDSLQPSAKEKGLELLGIYGEDLPERVNGDAFRLRQVLHNLLTNSIKFTHTGSVEMRVSQSDGMFCFEVEDTGMGIPEEVQKRLFAPFIQADMSTTRKFGGMGLGLATSRRIIELMGGTIGLTSVVGQGTRFWIQLALEPVAASVAGENAELR